MANKVSAQCHCGAVQFTVELSDGFNTIRRCNCSFCRMRGAVVVSAPLSGVTVLKGKDKLTEYRFNTRTAAHYFCMRHLHLPSASFQARSIWRERGLH